MDIKTGYNSWIYKCIRPVYISKCLINLVYEGIKLVYDKATSGFNDAYTPLLRYYNYY